MKRNVSGGGFTLLELVAIVIVAAIVAVVFILPNTGRRTGCGNRQLKDSTQVRGIHQGLITWAQSHNDQFPLPSALDVGDATVADVGTAKDHTANILSPLIFNGVISTEILLNPAEASGNIKLKDDYEFENPKAAVNPSKALWDPSLSSDFTSATGGNNSYAHTLPSGPRLPEWSNTFNQSAAILGNRGPQIAGVKQLPGSVTPTFVNPKSLTFLIHGSRSGWEGNIGFNDNHVEFMTSLKAGSYRDSKGIQRDDILFFDEPDDPAGANNFLGVFTKAGPTPAAFKSIWD